MDNNQTRISSAAKAMPYVYFSLLILAMMLIGPSPVFYFIFIFFAALFILPDRHLLGLSLAIFLTMIFERFFTLQGLAIDLAVYKFYLLDAVICFSWLALLNSYLAGKSSKRIIFGWPELILCLWLTLVGGCLIRSYFDINADFSVAFSSFKNYFFYPLLYLFVILAIDSGKKLKDIIHLILLTAVALIGFIFIGFIRGQGLWTEFTPLSTAGVRYLAGTHAFYLALAFALGLPLLLYKRLRNVAFSMTVMGLWLIGVAVSLMRHLWLALAVALVAIIIFFERKIKKSYINLVARGGLAAITAAIIISLFVSLLFFQGSMAGIQRNFNDLSARVATIADLNADSSATWRQSFWNGAGIIWSANPIFGVGFGHTMLLDSESYQTFEEIRNIHNSPLAITVQMGLIGLIVFIAFILSVVISSLKNIYADNDLKPYYLGILTALFVFLIACFFQPYLETNLMGIWLWILLGLLRTASLKISYADTANQ